MEITQNKGKQFDAVHNSNSAKQAQTKFFSKSEEGNILYFEDLAVSIV